MTNQTSKDVCDQVQNTATIVAEQTGAMAAIFRTISRLTDDSEIKALCQHGALQGDLAENDLDVLREMAEQGFPKDLQGRAG